MSKYEYKFEIDTPLSEGDEVVIDGERIPVSSFEELVDVINNHADVLIDWNRSIEFESYKEFKESFVGATNVLKVKEYRTRQMTLEEARNQLRDAINP